MKKFLIPYESRIQHIHQLPKFFFLIVEEILWRKILACLCPHRKKEYAKSDKDHLFCGAFYPWIRNIFHHPIRHDGYNIDVHQIINFWMYNSNTFELLSYFFCSNILCDWARMVVPWLLLLHVYYIDNNRLRRFCYYG